jgi:Uma2 family endonuclease
LLYNAFVSILLESPLGALSVREVAEISRDLADDISRLVLKSEGFSEADYLSLEGAYFVEYHDGCLQVLPMPTALHQAIAFVLARRLVESSKADPLARTKLAPFRIRLNEREYREPDICFMRGENANRRTDLYWLGADLVIEIISESNRDHDIITKRKEYAAAGIPEYWLVDPLLKTIQILVLKGDVYVPHGEFHIGDIARSAFLAGFEVAVAELFVEAEREA